ncbi:MAG: hypothetical protein PT977_05495 [Acidobacteriota bacterium]|nr:hypothetical protein [Acidobacteriota bacterium]
MRLARAAVLALAAVSANAQQAPAPTPAQEHVVAPSLPDQPNKEGVVRPSGSMPTDSEGYVRTNRGPVDPSAGKPTPAGAPAALPAPAPPAAGSAQMLAVPNSTPGPRGPAEVKAAYLSLRGTVKAYARGVSITIVEKEGVERTVKLAAKVSVYDGLAAGDKVVLRIPLENPADGQSTDRVSKQRPPKAPPKSKFSAAQSPVR